MRGRADRNHARKLRARQTGSRRCSRIHSPISRRADRAAEIEKALIGQRARSRPRLAGGAGALRVHGVLRAGAGRVVWLALSELMPTRIRSNGMSIALVINQLVSTTLAAIFLPFVSKHGYSSMFFLFAGFTVVYFLVAAFFLPETKGKTLEEIEAHFGGTASGS